MKGGVESREELAAKQKQPEWGVRSGDHGRPWKAGVTATEQTGLRLQGTRMTLQSLWGLAAW